MADGSVTIDTKLDNQGFKDGLGSLEKIGGKFASAAKATFAVGAAAVGAATAGVVALGKASVQSYAQLEQNIGGVETLFKDSADKVIKNANKAYKTAGMSANQYMENVTSFSASLLQSVANDTNKAADIADMAMVDMSDNANKMGTDMASIQNAYQGFAKQNYTMLDNLKLGYGGTKSEMERLLKDAEKLTGVKYDINNLADVYQAIHVIQEEIGITGTTALEAESTISGSISSLKASWDNFLNGSGDLSQVIENVQTVLTNVMNAVSKILPGLIDQLVKGLPEMIKIGIDIIKNLVQGLIKALPQIIKAVKDIIGSLAQALMDNIDDIIDAAFMIIESIVDTLVENIDKIIKFAVELILKLIDGIIALILNPTQVHNLHLIQIIHRR